MTPIVMQCTYVICSVPEARKVLKVSRRVSACCAIKLSRAGTR